MGDTKPSIQVTITIDGVATIKKVKGDSFVVGRQQDCDVNVLHPQVSRNHLKITVQGEKIFFEDVGSSNGTFLNDAQDSVLPKKVYSLNARDILQLGDHGPTLQVQLEQAIDASVLPKVIQVAPAAVVPTAVPPKLPDVPKAPISSPSPAAFTVPVKESDKAIIEANKQAILILQKAEVQAEAKMQEAHKHAMEIEHRAERAYQARMKEVNVDAEKLFEEAKQESLKLIQEARGQTQILRDQAEQDARDLRRTTEEKCEQKIKDTHMEGEEIKIKRLAEADQIIEKKGQELLKATYEKIEKEKETALKNLDNLKAQTSKAREAKETTEQELSKVEKELIALKKDLEKYEDQTAKTKESFEKVKAEEKSTLSHIELMKKELAEQEKTLSKVRAESEKFTLSISSMKTEKEDKEKELNAQIQTLKAKIEEEKSILNKQEEDRTNQLKLETAEAIKKFERELIEEILSRKTQMTKEILLQVEALCPTVARNEDWKSKQTDLNQMIQDIIGNTDQSSVKKVADGKTNKFSKRTKEKAFSMALGLCMGLLVFGVVDKVGNRVDGNSPIERMVANAIDSSKADLEKRKFNPPQVSEVKGSYVDAVIYTKDFKDLYLDPQYQEAWTKAATLYLLKMWRMDEDKSTRVLAASAALVKDLSERKEKIHPDFVKSGISKMREAEKETLARMKSELGGEVRLESFKKYEKRFFENYDRTPASKD